MSSRNQVEQTTTLSENELLEAASQVNWNNPNQTSEGRLSSLNLDNTLGRYFEDSPNDVVLEVGCSEGYTTAELSDMLADSTVEGRDISEDNVENAEAAYNDNWNVELGSARNPNISSNPGLVVASHSLGQLTDKGVIKKAWENRDDVALDRGEASNFYIEEVLESLGETTKTGGYLVLADDHNYLVAENTQEGWKPVEGRDFKYTQMVRDMVTFEREVEKDHTDFYKDWLEPMIDTDYEVKTADLT